MLFITITNAFQKTLDGSNHKPNKIWVDKGSELINEIMARKCVQYNRDVFNR